MNAPLPVKYTVKMVISAPDGTTVTYDTAVRPCGDDHAAHMMKEAVLQADATLAMMRRKKELENAAAVPPVTP